MKVAIIVTGRVTENEDVAQAVLRITDQRGARIVFDAVGGKAFTVLVAAAAAEGIILVYEALSKEENIFPAIQAIRKKLTIRGTTGILRDDLRIEGLKAYVTGGLKSGDFRPIIAKTFPFDRIVDARRSIESSEQFGKVILTV